MTPARRALLALSWGGFGIGTGEFVMLGLLPNVAASLHVSIPHAGYLISAYALGVVVGAPLLTPVSVWVPRRRFLILLTLVLAGGNLASALAPNFNTLLVLRFLSGLPHGAYFGVASVVAGSMVSPQRRSRAMAIVFAGLTAANVVGVPLTTLLGQQAGWRLTYGVVALAECLATAAIILAVPRAFADHQASDEPVRLGHELAAFRQGQIWLSLGIAAIGGAALFSTFSYIAPMMTRVAGFSSSALTPLLVLFGLGMTAGNLVGAHFADRSLMRTIYVALGAETLVALLFFFAVHDQGTALLGLFLLPFCALSILPSLQNRIVLLAGAAPNLAAASIHAAFNIANSIGALAGAAIIAAGLGYAAPNLAAAGFAALGLSIALSAGALERRTATAARDRAGAGASAHKGDAEAGI